MVYTMGYYIFQFILWYNIRFQYIELKQQKNTLTDKHEDGSESTHTPRGLIRGSGSAWGPPLAPPARWGRGLCKQSRGSRTRRGKRTAGLTPRCLTALFFRKDERGPRSLAARKTARWTIQRAAGLHTPPRKRGEGAMLSAEIEAPGVVHRDRRRRQRGQAVAEWLWPAQSS